MFQKQLLRILWNKNAPRLIRKILRKYHAEKLKVFLKSPKGCFFYKLLSSCVKVKQVCELIGQICLMAWDPISNTGLVNTKFGELIGGVFSGLFLCADHENQYHSAPSRQNFFLNSIDIFTFLTFSPTYYSLRWGQNWK